MSERTEALLSQLTLEEKVGLMSGIDMWHTMPVPRLGIPSIKVTDGPHGCRTMDDADTARTIPATCFPTGSALGATWNPDLIELVGQALGEETRARGCAVLLGPCVNIHRSPLGGRNFESYSEDPYLSSRITAAYIKGVQSRGTGVSVKHFGLNNQEFERMTVSSEASVRAMREIYFPSFEAAVKEAGAWTVMCSYNRLNGTYAADARWLLTDILKEEWDFDGLVMSDWFAVHSTAEAAGSGLDLEMPGPSLFFGDKLVEAVNKGQVDEAKIDDSVRRILTIIERSGALDQPLEVNTDRLDIPEHGILAREVAGEAMVLLKNDGGLLPLDTDGLKSIAVIGPNAATAAIQGGGSARVEPHYVVTPLEGLHRAVQGNIEIIYELGCPNNIRTLPLDMARFSTPDLCEPGLRGEYFDNNELNGQPVVTRTDTSLDFRWFGSRGPVKSREFSIRWTGTFTPPEDGTYTFGLVTDGWTALFIGESEVCGTWGSSEARDVFAEKEETGTIEMEAGRAYPVKLEYTRNPDAEPKGRLVRLGCNPPLFTGLPERAATAAAGADAAIVFVGLSEEFESEGFDRKTMDLPGAQVKLIEKVAAANPNTVVVLHHGAPVTMKPWIDKVPAVLEAWFAGQECGNAVADILLGEIDPSGRLADTLPVRYEDNPAYGNYPGSNGKVVYAEDVFTGYRHYDEKNIEPLYPFGHGLSYTTFEYTNLQISPEKAGAGEAVTVNIDVTNTGKRAGKDVVQVYVRDEESRLPRPPKELKGFRKIALEPGETKTIRIALDERSFSYYDPGNGGWVAEPGLFEIQVGRSSRDIRAKGKFERIG